MRYLCKFANSFLMCVTQNSSDPSYSPRARVNGPDSVKSSGYVPNTFPPFTAPPIIGIFETSRKQIRKLAYQRNSFDLILKKFLGTYPA